MNLSKIVLDDFKGSMNVQDTRSNVVITDVSRQAWLVAWLSMIGIMCCSSSVMLINIGVFMKPLTAAFGWSRGAIALSLSIGAISMAIVNPGVGRLIDRYGVRPVLISSLAGYALVTAMIPVLVDIAKLNGLHLGYALVSAVGAGSNVIAYVRVLSGWFSGPMNNSRGLAMGIATSGIPLGAAIAGPVGVVLIDRFGWQAGYFGLALVPLLIGLPIAVFGIRLAPHEKVDRLAAADHPVLPGMSLRQASHTRPFWVLLIVALLMSATLGGAGVHAAPLLSDFKASPQLVSLVLICAGIAGVAGRVVAGVLFDKFFAPLVSIAIFGFAAISALALASFPGLIAAILALLVIAFGNGAESNLIGFLIGRYFGLKAYGQIFGFVYGVFMVGVAVGPYLFSLAYDIWGNYDTAFLICGLGVGALCALLLLLPRFSPDQIDPDRG